MRNSALMGCMLQRAGREREREREMVIACSGCFAWELTRFSLGDLNGSDTQRPLVTL